MTIYAIYKNKKRKDEKSGEALFCVLTSENKHITCDGILPPIMPKTPLCIEGAFDAHEIFKVSHMSLCGYNKDVMINYLCTSEFNKIGKATAEKLIEETGADLFEYVRKYKDAETAFESLKSQNDAVRLVLERLKEKTQLEAILDHVTKLGGSYYNALKLNKRYRNNVLEAIQQNPYLLLYVDIPFYIVEKKAIKEGICWYDKKRIRALVWYAMDINKKNGNTRITFHELVELIHDIEKSSKRCTDPLFIAAELTTSKYRVIKEDGDFYVYEEKAYLAEKEIAENIYRINTSADTYIFDTSYIDEIEEELGIKYSEEQKEAFNIIKTGGVKVITGGPGTGKTTFLNGCIRLYKKNNPGIKIICCAPTGCAAARMHDSTGMKATTIHRLLGIDRDLESIHPDKIAANVIILDEISMVGIELFKTLLSAVKNGTSLILVGDKDQLPSVDAGNVLADLISSNVIETHHFEEIFRQSSGNSIIKNARTVIKGKVTLDSDSNFTIKRYKTEDEMLKSLESICKKSRAEYTVFTSARKAKFRSGSINLNRLVRDAKAGKSDDSSETLYYGDYALNVGDKIIFNKNNYDKGYYNGEVGIITSIQRINDSVRVSVSADEDMIYLEGGDLNDIELGYALTAHKAQGSECDNAIIVIAKNPANMLQRKLLYVEITRAKKNVFIMTEQDALEECITNERLVYRNTGLKNHLCQIFQ